MKSRAMRAGSIVRAWRAIQCGGRPLKLIVRQPYADSHPPSCIGISCTTLRSISGDVRQVEAGIVGTAIQHAFCCKSNFKSRLGSRSGHNERDSVGVGSVSYQWSDCLRRGSSR